MLILCSYYAQIHVHIMAFKIINRIVPKFIATFCEQENQQRKWKNLFHSLDYCQNTRPYFLYVFIFWQTYMS